MSTYMALPVVALVVGLSALPQATSQPASRPDRQPATQPDSDRTAIELARSVMQRMGGRDAWQATRYLTWNFFGSRRHLWDRRTGQVRIEGTDRESGEPYLILMNLHTKDGRAWRDGRELTEPEALAEMIERGTSAWINDSYWLVMPYKLLDPGVTLKDLGERPMSDGRAARALELTFNGVGETPRNKYLVYVAADTGLVEQWDFYEDRADAEPRFQIPWRNWTRHGKIMLSGDRGESRGRARELTDIAVLGRVPADVLTSPAPVDWKALIGKK